MLSLTTLKLLQKLLLTSQLTVAADDFESVALIAIRAKTELAKAIEETETE